jgi:hypothetical protein
MSERARQATGAAQRGDGEAGMDARGRATQGAVADAGMDARGRATQGAVAEDAARAAKARRSAWLLGGLALFFYFGYMAWIYLSAGGG